MSTALMPILSQLPSQIGSDADFDAMIYQRADHCRDCYFWQCYDDQYLPDVGECHRYPPQVYCTEDAVVETMPTTYDHNWCGEFKRKT